MISDLFLTNPEERLSIALKARKMGVWELNTDTQMMKWDEAMFQMYGLDMSNYPDQAISIEKWGSMIIPQDLARVFAEFEAAEDRNQQAYSMFQITTPSGERRTLKTAAVFYKSSSSVKATRLVGVNWDVTESESIKQQAALDHARAISQSKMAALGEMAAGLAHEINNPLTILLNSVSLMKMKLANGEIDQSLLSKELDKLEKNSLRISKIVRGLRSFSRNAENDPFVPYKLSLIIEDSLNLCSEKFKWEKIEIQIFDETQSCDVMVRPSQVSQVLLNLLLNALDASRKSSVKRVTLRSYQIKDFVYVEIEDLGEGVVETNVEKIFLPFFTTKPVGEGTGLGLPISKGIIDDHGGQFELVSSKNPTMFRFSLPIYSPNLSQRGKENMKVPKP